MTGVGRSRPLRLGTRGSALAMAQTSLVAAALEGLGFRVEVVVIRTEGDRRAASPTAVLGVGAFVRDLETALLDRRIDAAVHSAKDLPAGADPALALPAFLPRGPAADVLISRQGLGLRRLPPAAVIATDSPRRRAFLLAARRDLRLVGIRGNVDTRLRKLEAGAADALVLAAAGLDRLGLADRITEVLDPSVMLPAVGQGAVVVQARADDRELVSRLAALDDAATRAAVLAERACLTGLGGGCQRPIAAHAVVQGSGLVLEGAVLDPEGTIVVRDRAEGPAAEPAAVGGALARRLLERGADRLLFDGVAVRGSEAAGS